MSIFPGTSFGHALPDESLRALLLLHREGSRTLVVNHVHELLSKGLPSLTIARKLHSLLISSGLDSIAFLGDHLIQCFVSCGSLLDANLSFCNVVEPSVYTWYALLSSYLESGYNAMVIYLYQQMQMEGSFINEFIFTGILKACAVVGDIEHGKEVHIDVVRRGCESDLFLRSALIDMYIKCGFLDDARQEFDSSMEQDSVLWNTIIAGYARYGYASVALELFDEMQNQGHNPSQYVYSSVLKACCSVGTREEGRYIHARVVQIGLALDSGVANALINMYVSHCNLDRAREVFDKMVERTIVSWGTMIAGYAQYGRGLDALLLFERMQHETFKPNRPTLLYTLKACSSLDAITEGMIIHDQVLKSGLDSDVRIGTGLVELYSKCGNFSEGKKVHDNLADKNLVSWCVLIQAYVNHKRGVSALCIFKNLQHEGFLPDKALYICVLKACGHIRDLGCIKLVHIGILSNLLAHEEEVQNCLIHAYSKCDDMSEARKLFEMVPGKSLRSWSSMISGYAEHGHHILAIRLYEKMCQENRKPDRVIFLDVMKACANLGSSNYAKEIHDDIIRTGIEEDAAIGNALINMYGKCGELDGASKVFHRLPTKDIVSWGAIMYGYACYSDLHQCLDQCLEGMQQEGLKPNDVVCLNLLLACSHLGAIEETRKIFHFMDIHYNILPRDKHITCMADLLGRAGFLDEAECLLVGNYDLIGHTSFLSACRLHGKMNSQEGWKNFISNLYVNCGIAQWYSLASSPKIEMMQGKTNLRAW